MLPCSHESRKRTQRFPRWGPSGWTGPQMLPNPLHHPQRAQMTRMFPSMGTICPMECPSPRIPSSHSLPGFMGLPTRPNLAFLSRTISRSSGGAQDVRNKDFSVLWRQHIALPGKGQRQEARARKRNASHQLRTGQRASTSKQALPAGCPIRSPRCAIWSTPFQRPLWLQAACLRPGGVPFLSFKFSICKMRIIPKGPQGGCEA